jgi:CheY-like chemotaxis protein
VAKIRALVVDDDPRLIEHMKSRIGRELGWEIEWQSATDVDEGLRLITSAAGPFDLLIADLMFYREDVPDLDEARGLELISEASQHSTRTFILAISTGSNYQLDLMDNAKTSGAHHVVRRNEFSTASAMHSPKAIAAEIREHLLDNGTVSACEVIFDAHDPGIQGLLHQVGGPATVARLHSKILEAGGHQTSRIEVRFLTPGASGASVCTVTAQVDGMGRMSHILKLSQAKELLAREAERGKRAAEMLPTLLVEHRPAHSVGPVNGWYALGGPLIERATTLRGWLALGPSPGAVDDVLEALLIDGLGQVYADGHSEPEEPLASFVFTPYRQRCILQALDELKAALARGDGGGLGDAASDIAAYLTAFVIEERLPQVPARAIPQTTLVCYGHGDLHGDNVLVSTGQRPRPLLIDPSHFGMAHWANDPARLAVDLLMRSVDAGTESMLFTGFGTWRILASRFATGQDNLAAVTDTRPTSAALAALSWITANLYRMSPAMEDSVAQNAHRWEWHVSLARNLLRATYHSDIPHAKRALAFVAAYDQLAAASAAIPG